MNEEISKLLQSKTNETTSWISNCWDKNKLLERLAEIQIEKMDLDNLYQGEVILK